MNAATMSFRQLKAQTLNLILENKTTFCNHLGKSWTGIAKRILIFSLLSLKVMLVAARKVSGSALSLSLCALHNFQQTFLAI